MFGREKISLEFTFDDMSEDVKKMTVQQIKNALTQCGAQAASFAAVNCGAHLKPVVDTGLLRNSLTFALAGKVTKIQDYKGDRPSRYRARRSGSRIRRLYRHKRLLCRVELCTVMQ